MFEKLPTLNFEPCRFLRTKGMYVNAGIPEGGEPIAGDGHAWCLATAEALGPDRETVSRRDCRPGRRCYEPVI